MTESLKNGLCVFGEVLFDHFPDGTRVLGGAPFNVAWHLQAMCLSPYFISRVGRDAEGEAVRDAMHDWGMSVAGLQYDNYRPTGQVRVSLTDGEPSYDIVEDCAYDAIEAPALEHCSVLYHGSLATRSVQSAGALKHLRELPPELVFIDVNLRPPWWQRSQLQELLHGAHWVKLNHDELRELHDKGAAKPDTPQDIIDKYGLRGVVVTHGAAGAEILLANGEHASVKSTPDTNVVDTVGAGDAFASVIIVGLLQQWPAALTLQRAQQFAAAIVARRGATVADRNFYREFLREWGLIEAQAEN